MFWRAVLGREKVVVDIYPRLNSRTPCHPPLAKVPHKSYDVALGQLLKLIGEPLGAQEYEDFPLYALSFLSKLTDSVMRNQSTKFKPHG
jgi:hypothetical protein